MVRWCARPLAKGQPVTQNMLVHPGERGFLAAVLTPGNRAVSVPVNKTTGISGFVFPGDRVDLVLSLRLKGEDEEGKGQTRYASLTLLEGVRVLAIDQAVDNAEGDAMPAKTATLEVTPLQAEKIALSLQMGSLSLSLTSLQKKEQKQIVGNGTERLQTVSLRDDAKPIDAPNADTRGRNFTLDIEVFTVNGKDMTLKFPQRSKRRAGRESVTVLRGSESAKAKF